MARGSNRKDGRVARSEGLADALVALAGLNLSDDIRAIQSVAKIIDASRAALDGIQVFSGSEGTLPEKNEEKQPPLR